MRSFLTGCWYLIFIPFLDAQCEFTQPIAIADEQISGFNLLVSNAVNNDLGAPGQGVCQVFIKFNHDVVGDINISLLSPSNQWVQLIGAGGTSSGFTDGATWDISFTACSSPSSPDPGYSEVWSNEESWQAFRTYEGTYYPYQGCLEDFNTGQVNGTWTLLVEDVAELDDGSIANFSIIFCDPTGIDCTSCNPPQLGITQETVEICQGVGFTADDIAYNWASDDPDTFQFNLAYLFFDSTGYLGLLQDTLVSSIDTGDYKICMVSYHASDEIYLDSLPEMFPDTLTNQQLLSAGICGKVAGCISLHILPVSDTLFESRTICEGDTLLFSGQKFTNAGVYTIAVDDGKCDSIYRLTVIVLEIIPDISLSHPLLDCTHEVIDITLNGLNSAGYTFSWFTDNGNIIAGSNAVTASVNAAGDYIFEINTANCSYTDTVFIGSDVSLPELNLTSNELSCDSPEVTIFLSSASAITDVQWTGSGPITGSGLAIKVSQPGIYTALATDDKGCKIAKSITIGSNTKSPFLSFKVNQINCMNSFAMVSVLDSANIKEALWKGFGAENPTLLNTRLLSPGIYELSLKGFNGCDTLINIQVIDEAYLVDVSLTPDTINCRKSSVQLKPASSRVIKTQVWTYPNQEIVNILNPIVMIGGSYSVTVVDANGCSGSQTVFIATDTMAPQLIVTDKVINCDTVIAILQIDNAKPGYQYQWKGPGMFESGEPNPGVTEAGVYMVTVTDSNGCTSKAEINVTVSLDLPEIQFSAEKLNCAKSMALINPSDTTGIGFLWLSPNMLNLPNASIGKVDKAGVYHVRITAKATGCERDYFIQVVDIGGKASYRIGADSITCASDMASLFVTGEIKVKSYQWSGPGFTSNLSNPMVSTSGRYFVLMVDSSDCIYYDSIDVIKVNQVPDVKIKGQHLNCKRSVAELKASSTTSGVTYEWFKNNVSLGKGTKISVKDSGDYIVIGTAAGFCRDTQLFTVTLDLDPPYITIADINAISCSRDSVALNVISNEPLILVEWKGPDVGKLNSTGGWVKLPGLYSLIVTDTSGCSATLLADVPDSTTQINIEIQKKVITCAEQGSVQLILNVPDATVEWTQTPGFVPPGAISFTTSTGGIYRFTVTDPAGCTASGMVEILADTLRPDPEGFVVRDLTCRDSVIAIGFINGLASEFSVVWPISGIETDSIQVNTSGTYTAIITGTNGCTLQLDAKVESDTIQPVFTILGDSINCSQSKIDLVIASTDIISAVLWKGPEGESFTGDNIKVDKEGWYTAMVTGNNGCLAVDSFKLISDFTVPQIMIEDTFYLPCDSSGIQLFASASKPIVYYRWIGIDNPFFSDQSGPVVYTPNRISVGIASFNGCETLDTILVVPAVRKPDFKLAGDTIDCDPGYATLVAQLVADDKSFFWKNSKGEVLSTDTIRVNSSDTYVLTVIGDNACADSLTFFVPSDTIPPSIALTSDGIIRCLKTKSEINATINANADKVVFSWFTTDGEFISTQDSANAVVIKPGTYFLEVQDLDSGCSSVDSIKIFGDTLQLIADFDVKAPSCYGYSDAVISLDSFTGAVLPLQLEYMGTKDTSLSVSGLSSGVYELILSDAMGCEFKDTITVPQGRLIALSLPGDTSLIKGEEISISYTSNPPVVDWEKLIWQRNPGNYTLCAFCESVNIEPEEDWIVTLTGVDIYGCVASDTMLIKVDDDPMITLPNVLYPGAGLPNGYFFIPENRNIDYVAYLRIYDNWGNLIFRRDNFSPGDPLLGWDGTFSGMEVNPGVFVYLTEVVLRNGAVLKKSDDITVVR